MSKDREMGNLTVRLRADITQYLAMMDKASDTTGKTTSKIEKAAGKLGAVFTTVSTGIAAFATMAIKSAMDWGKAVDDLSDKTGMAGEDASKMLVVMKRAGVDSETAQGMMAKFGKAVYGAADSMAKAAAKGEESDDVLTKLGLAAVNLDGSMRPTLDIFNDVKNRLGQMDDGWQKTAFEMQLFGKSGAEMHDVLHMSNEEMQAAIEKARKLGMILSSEAAQAWEQFDRNVNSAKGTLTSLGIGIGNDFLPALTNALDKVQTISAAFTAWKDKNPSLAKSLEEVAAALALIVMEAKGLALIGVRSPWIIPILAVLHAGGQLAGSDAAKGAAQLEMGQWGVNQNEPGADYGKYLELEMKGGAFSGGTKPGADADQFIGGGGGKGKSAFEEFLEQQRMELSIIEKRRELRQISDQEYYSMLQAQRTALDAVVVAADEELKKRLAVLEIDVKIMQEDKKRANESAAIVARQYDDYEKTLNARVKLYTDVYAQELLMEEQKKNSNKEYLAWLLLESKKFNAEKDKMDNDQYLLEATREDMRREAIRKTNQEIAQENIRAANASKEAWADALTGIVTGNVFAADILKQIWTELVSNIIRQLMGLQTQSGGLLGSIFSMFGIGGNTVTNGVTGPLMTYDSTGMFLIPKFAEGGIPSVNKLSIVGETGPELFMPGRSGRIVSNAELGEFGGSRGDVIFHQTFQSLDPAENMRLVKNQLPMIKNFIIDAMKNEATMRSAVRGVIK